MRPQKVAVVGIGAAFPSSPDPARFWQHILAAKDLTQEVPAGRWPVDPALVYQSGEPAADKVYSTRGCFVDPTELGLDYSDLAIDADLLEGLDPLFQVGLYAAQQACRDAKGWEPARTGLIIGNIVLPTEKASALAREYLGRTFDERVTQQAEAGPLITDPRNIYAAGLPGSLIARALNLGCGSYTLDAACASSLYALKLAADELISGRVDVMISGGLSRPDCLYTQMGFAQLRALSARGKPSPFDGKGDGLVVGEGAGMVVLKRLQDAIDCGDHIYGVLHGFGLSNDTDGSLLAPDSEGQLRAMRSAYAQAGWRPDQVDLIECHATGTPLGDEVEIKSLTRLWSDAGDSAAAVIGSVKSNVGHLLTAAGSAAFIKVLLAMKEKTLPPTANFVRAPERFGLQNSPFRVLSQAEPWPESNRPRRAAISAFGFGGINAHVLVEEWCGQEVEAVEPQEQKPVPIAIVGLDAHFGPWPDLAALRQRLYGSDDQQPRPGSHWGTDSSEWFGKKSQSLTGHGANEVTVPFGLYRIPPKEIEEMLPQQLLMLATATAALRGAGLKTMPHNDSGVFVGIALDLNTTNFHLRWVLEEKVRRYNRELGLDLDEEQLSTWLHQLRDATGPALNANRTLGALGGMVASRIARELRFGGSSFTISSEDISGIRALEAGVRALQQGDLDLAIAGAVDFAGDLRATDCAQRARPEVNGQPTGDGAVAFVLKRYEDALADGDHIYSVIEGIGIASGKEPQKTWQLAMERAWSETGLSPQRLGYLEVAGGAQQEAEQAAVADFLPAQDLVQSTSAQRLGHTGAAAGATALLAASLCLSDRVLPAGNDSETTYWLRNRAQGSRLAAVNALGMDGNRAHVILRGHEQESERHAPLLSVDDFLFLVQGESDLTHPLVDLERAMAITQDMACLARDQWQPPKSTGKALVMMASTHAELAQIIRTAKAALQTERPEDHDGLSQLIRRERVFYTSGPLGQEAKVAFVFPGSGNQFKGMGRELALAWPHLFEQQDQQSLFLADQMGVTSFWSNRDMAQVNNDHRALLSGQVALGMACSHITRALGIEPKGAIGYSLGESVAMLALGAWSDRDELHRRSKDSDLFTHVLAGDFSAVQETWGLQPGTKIDWQLGVVNRPAEIVSQVIAGMERVYLLIVNTPQECVIGGDGATLKKVVRELGCGYVALPGVTAVHCEVLEPVADRYRAHHLFDTDAPAGVSFYSGNWGKAYDVTRDSIADSILANARSGLDFPKTISSAYADGFNLFLEMGPGNSCTRMIKAILGDKRYLAQAVCYEGTNPVRSLLAVVGQLIAHRVPVGPDYPLAGEPVAEKPERLIRVPVGGEAFRIPSPPKAKVVAPKASAPRPMRPQPQVAIHGVAPPSAGLAASTEALVSSVSAGLQARNQAHEAFLRFSQENTQSMNDLLRFQMQLVQEIVPGGNYEALMTEPTVRDEPTGPGPFMDREACLAFARGTIAEVLGPEFSKVDSYPCRVRLPDEPLMLVDRILQVGGERMTSGFVDTEHDILPDAWYLDCGRIPTCIAVEAGQADLFLSGYLGIDFETKGMAVYRLLDAVVRFHRELPGPGETIHSHIKIDNFFRQGKTHLFRFSFEGSVNGEKLVTMTEGCAGFFSAEELDSGKGIVQTTMQKAPQAGKRPQDWQDLVPMAVESYDEHQVDALRRGDLAGCFGERFAGLPLQNPLGIPGGPMKLVDRVLRLEPGGGRYGLGFIRAEADIHPDDWFIVCHFIDDRVMPGTLMYECCLHTLRIYLLRMGWVAEQGEVTCQPVIGVGGRLKCRGQVLETTKKVLYEVTIKELGYEPAPYAVVDALMYSDGKPIVEINGMSLRMTGSSRERMAGIWANCRTVQAAKPVLFNSEQILAYAVGNPSEGFGDRYEVFDKNRILARLPGPPFLFLDRIVHIEAEQWKMVAGGKITGEYDIPADAWYFDANRSETMPFVVLLEIALQPCGWFAAYMGSALTSEADLHFRNLGGKAVQHRPIDRTSGTLSIAIRCTGVSSSGGMVIQNYDLAVSDAAGMIYEGVTNFGFFSAGALANQIGLRDAKPYQPTAAEQARSRTFNYPETAPFPETELRMIDRVSVYVSDGGPEGLGFISGTKKVDPAAWFFKAHFYQDPVIPGSLGLESFFQLLKVMAHDRWGGEETSRFETIVCGEGHEWVYRGQVIPTDDEVTVQAVVRRTDEASRTMWADGFLMVDGRIIYQMKGFSLRLT